MFTPVLQGAGTIQDVVGGSLSGITSFFSGNNIKNILNIVAVGGFSPYTGNPYGTGVVYTNTKSITTTITDNVGCTVTLKS